MLSSKVDGYALYSNNFRGVPNGWHTLGRVNFLVGENSTGKTSLIQLLEILDSPQFIMLNSMVGVIDGLNSTFDVISRRSSSKSVSIGFSYISPAISRVDKQDDSVKEARAQGKIVDYLASGERLKIKKISLIIGNQVVSLKSYSERMRFRVRNIPQNVIGCVSKLASWFGSIHASNRNFEALDGYDATSDADEMIWLAAMAHVAGLEGGRRFTNAMGRSPLRCYQYGPMRGKPRRMYYGSKNEFSSAGEHVPYIMKDRLRAESPAKNAIEKFGRESGLYDYISVASVTTKINDRPFAIQVKKDGKFFYVDEMGFGVGQILPIVADVAFSVASIGYLLQQPELHLHPRAQAAFGEFLFEAASEGHFFVVETHSDYLIDRFRLMQKKKGQDFPSQILYFEQGGDLGKNVCTGIPLVNGEVCDAPDSYRSFFLEESMHYFENL